jgi:hypothetical protein
MMVVMLVADLILLPHPAEVEVAQVKQDLPEAVD